jgi:Na+/H+ antiporter NhaD/arsenite permease-like protein
MGIDSIGEDMAFEQLKLKHQLCFPIYAASRLIIREYQPHLEKLGITYPQYLVLMVLWVSGIASGFLDNIPFTITMIPIVRLMLETTPIPNNILWWALSLGACLGGNLTMIGASANIVSIGMAKRSGVHISFLEFMKTSVVITLITLCIASLYLCAYLWISL